MRWLIDAVQSGVAAQAAVRAPTLAPFAKRLKQSLLTDQGVLVELLAPNAAVTDRWPRQLAGMQLLAAGWDAWLVRMPVRDVPQIAKNFPAVQQARLPWGRTKHVGSQQSQGVKATGAELAQCTGADGAGISVAVMDDEWHGLSEAEASGDLPNMVGKAPYQDPLPDSYHGTACAEIVADMAPAADLYAIPAPTLAEMQVAVNKLGNAGITLVSDSAGWTTGYSFGDNTGKPCELVKIAKKKGIAWIVSAGNEGDHSMWIGNWQDQDGDGWLDFDGSNRAELWGDKGIDSDVELDWDAYPVTAVDLDLYLCSGWPCKELAVSNATQDGAQAPQEVLNHTFKKAGAIYVGVRLKPGAAPIKGKLGVRVAAVGEANLNPWVANGTIDDPAQCSDAFAVGAIDWDHYQTGPASDYSSRGPTWDGRTKPDIAAPTAVATTVSDVFDGTSAACPHMAGAVALQMQRGNQTSLEAAALLVKQAIPMSDKAPDNDFGHGRLDFGLPANACTAKPAADATAEVTAAAEPVADAGATQAPDSAPEAVAAADSAQSAPAKPAPASAASSCSAGSRRDESVAHAGLAMALAAIFALLSRRRLRDDPRHALCARGEDRHVRNR